MEFPKAFLLVTFYLFALVSADLSAGKNKLITDHMNEFGNGITKNINYEITTTAKVVIQRATIKRLGNDVMNCIKNLEKEGLETVKQYSRKFLDEVQKYQSQQSILSNGMFSKMADDDVQVLKTLNQLAISFIKNSKKVEAKTAQGFEKCFPENYP